MFKVGKVINYYKGIDILIVQLSSDLSVGDTIKVYKDGEELFKNKIQKILVNNQNIPFAKSGDVIGLSLEDVGQEKEKIQKGAEVFRLGQLGIRS
ncbi:MAG: hypothetical protein WA152_01215 [Microgenomates group bacterium]